MKKFITLFVLLLILSTSSFAETWQVTHLPSTWQNMNPAVGFTDSATGCLGGYGIIRTTNAGGNWTTVLNGSIAVITNLAIKGQVGYATGHPFGAFGSFIYKTSNAGANWSLVYNTPDDTVYCRSIEVINDNFALVTVGGGTNNYIWLTTNGGQNWSTEFSTPELVIVSSAASNDSLKYVATYGNFWAHSNGEWIQRSNLDYTVNHSNTLVHNHNVFVGGQRFNTVNLFQFVINKSSDEGLTWHHTLLNDSSSGYCQGIAFNQSLQNVGYAVGSIYGNGYSIGKVYKTTNEGESWSEIYQMDNNYFENVVTTERYIYISCRGGIIRYDSDDFPLPVELSSFISIVINNSVTLNWTTASETNNAEFHIERSDIYDTWKKVGNILGNGTVTGTHEYSFVDKKINSGIYNYRLKQIDYNGNYEYHYLSQQVIVGVPNNFSLSQNYPNPFNPETNINYSIPIDGLVTLKLYNIVGKEVMTVVHERKIAGYHTVKVNASVLTTGVYIYRLQLGNNILIKRMTLIK